MISDTNADEFCFRTCLSKLYNCLCKSKDSQTNKQVELEQLNGLSACFILQNLLQRMDKVRCPGWTVRRHQSHWACTKPRTSRYSFQGSKVMGQWSNLIFEEVEEQIRGLNMFVLRVLTCNSLLKPKPRIHVSTKRSSARQRSHHQRLLHVATVLHSSHCLWQLQLKLRRLTLRLHRLLRSIYFSYFWHLPASTAISQANLPSLSQKATQLSTSMKRRQT